MGGVLVLCGVGLWHVYFHSSDFRSRSVLAEARLLTEEGKLGEAAERCVDLILQQGDYADEARSTLSGALHDAFTGGDISQMLDAAAILMEMPTELHLPEPFLPDTVRLTMAGALSAEAVDDRNAAERLLACALRFSMNTEQQSALRKRRIALLESIVATRVDDGQAAVRLALAYEEVGNLEAILPILEKHQAYLGAGEGARALGQAYAHVRRNEEAMALLVKYLEARIDAFGVATSHLASVTEAQNQRWLNFLNDGRAESAFYQEFNLAADEERRELVVHSWIQGKLDSDVEVVRARASLVAFDQVVSVAIDLGFLQLESARERADTNDRLAELQRAEATFLSVQDAAGESDEYRLYLGQVYSWMGRGDASNGLFEAFLESNHRSAQALAMLSVTVRDLGDMERCRKLLDEAYASAAELSERQSVARQRAAAAIDNDARIVWLRRSNLDDPESVAALHSALGEQAREQGDDERAILELRMAIGLYAKLSESATTLNNGAGAASALFRMTGDIDDYRRSTAMLTAAAALVPNDPVILANVGSNLIEGVVMEWFNDRANMPLMSDFLDFSSLRYLYSNATERSALYLELKRGGGLLGGLEYLQQVARLAPNDSQNLAVLAAYLYRMEDEDGLAVIARKVDGVEQNVVKDYRVKRQSMARHVMNKTAKLLEVPAIRSSDLDFAIAATLHVEMGMQLMEDRVDSDLVAGRYLTMAREAHRRYPSSSTLTHLIDVLMAAGLEQAAATDADIADMRLRCLKAMDISTAARFLLELGGDRADVILQQPFMGEALSLLKLQQGRFPSRVTSAGWAPFRHADSDYAVQLADRIEVDTLTQTYESIQRRIAPSAVDIVLSRFWGARLRGDDTRAQKLYELARDAGMPLPVIY